jgi:hypothetical protein
MDDSPFIVMPFMKNGNVLDYIEMNPQFNRLRMVCLLMFHYPPLIKFDSFYKCQEA